MAKDLRHFMESLQAEQPDDLLRVSRPVSVDREPAALLHRLADEGRSPVVWFERISDCTMPLVVNCHDTLPRLALAMGVPADQVHRAYVDRLAQLIEPIDVPSGPVQDIVIEADDVDLNRLPMIRPSDNATARYLGGGILVGQDPATGIVNLSFNRMMLQAPNRMGFHASPGLHFARILKEADRRGESLPVAIIVGHHPAFSLGVLAKVPFEIDEYACAGAMLQDAVPLVTCRTSGLRVPAFAEVVLEGRVLHGVTDMEGPYDEFTGYATPAMPQPVIEVTCITHRRDPIWQDIFGGTDEHRLMGAVPKEASQLANLRAAFPFVRDIHMSASGGGRLHAAIAVGPHPAGAPKRVADAAMATDHYLKHVFVVDDDVDVRNERQVMWAFATQFQADRDLTVYTDRPGSSIDPSADDPSRSAKLIFDCTRPRDDFPPANRIDPAILEKMNLDRWLPESSAGTAAHGQ